MKISGANLKASQAIHIHLVIKNKLKMFYKVQQLKPLETCKRFHAPIQYVSIDSKFCDRERLMHNRLKLESDLNFELMAPAGPIISDFKSNSRIIIFHAPDDI